MEYGERLDMFVRSSECVVDVKWTMVGDSEFLTAISNGLIVPMVVGTVEVAYARCNG